MRPSCKLTAAMVLASTLLAYAEMSAAQSPVLHVGFIERAPHIYAKADGTVKGMFGRKLQNLFRRAGVDAELVRVRGQNIDQYLDIAGLDAFIITPLLIEDPGNYVLSEQALIRLQFHAYYLSQSAPVSRLADLKNTRLILPFSLDSMQGEIKQWLTNPDNKVTIVETILNLDRAIPLLRRGDADYAISHMGPNTTATVFAKRFNRRELDSNVVFELPMFLAIEREFDNAAAVMQRINEALKDPG